MEIYSIILTYIISTGTSYTSSESGNHKLSNDVCPVAGGWICTEILTIEAIGS